MNINKPRRKNTLWHMEVQTREEAYAAVAADLSAFNQCKKTLLDSLYSAYERGPKSEPFDEEKSWLDLLRLANSYFWGKVMRQETLSPSKSFNQLLKLAKALHRAHDLAMQEGIGGDLFKAWFAENKVPLASATHFKDGQSVLTLVADELKKAVAGLATLETAAFAAAAANAVPPKSGRPPLLPSQCIEGLARVYRGNTGSKPGRGDGPFARFVHEFITAVNRPNFEFKYDGVIDAIKNAHDRHKTSIFDA
jgi:hypothetical protein